MDTFWRKKYQREAAMWAAEGKLAMSIQPNHLLDLLREHRPPPDPTETERRLEALRRELRETQGKLRAESERANGEYARGHAAAVIETAAEIRTLRAQAATARARRPTLP